MDKNRIYHVARGNYLESLKLTEEEKDFMTKKIFGIGLGRTGTKSLHFAMWELGYISTHGVRHIEAVHENQFACDISISCKYKFLDYCFPEAKFILTIRDLDSWLLSCEYHLPVRLNNEGTYFPHLPLVNTRLRRAESRFLIYGITHYDRDVFIQTYHKFHREVIEHFSSRKDKLLILNICNGEGWEKLCPFVDRPIPDIPFPHKHIGIHREFSNGG